MKYFSCLILILIFVQSCVKNNTNPAWLDIASWQLEENPDLNTLEGALSQNFTDVYIIIDGEVLGFFELPIKLPVLKEGKHKILFYPAIKNNGISATKRIFPFCTAYQLQVDFQANQTIFVQPVTHYASNCQFWIEDFEDASIKILTDDAYSTGTITPQNDPAILKYGSYYGHIALTDVNSTWLGYTNPAMALPQGASEVFLEIDYMNTNSLLTGLFAFTPTNLLKHPNIQLNRQASSDLKWKKIYIDLKELVSASTGATAFSHYFNANIDFGLSKGDIYIDNIKVIHF